MTGNHEKRYPEAMPLKGKSAPDMARVAEHADLRHAMVREQILGRGIRDPRLLDALRAVPRHLFVSAASASSAYADMPLPIGEGQTISQPFMVAAMTNALQLSGHERVLEVGTGSGYQAAILSLLAREVHTIENHPALARDAAERLARLGYTNVSVHEGDGTLGWPAAAPYDAILVSAAAPSIPPPLLEQLFDGGRLVIPVGDTAQQELLRVRKPAGPHPPEVLHYCRFVPLVGRHGWPDSKL